MALAVGGVGDATAQVDTCCATGNQVRLEFNYLDMLEQIRAYEDTLSALTGAPVEDDYRQLEEVTLKLYQQYDGFELEDAINDLKLLIAQARASSGGDVCAPCTIITGGDITYNSYNYARRELCGSGASYCYLRTLRTEMFQNGDTITDGNDSEVWAAAEAPRWAEYPDVGTSPAGLGLQTESHWGYHYNPYAILDDRELCPPGWAIPDSAILNLAIDENEVPPLQLREGDGTWLDPETWLVTSQFGDYNETEYTTVMRALSFAGEEVPNSLAFYADNTRSDYSTYGLPSPNSGYLSEDSNYGLSVGCYLLPSTELATRPEYVEWKAKFSSLYPERIAAANQEVEENIFITNVDQRLIYPFHEFPHVRTLESNNAFTIEDGVTVELRGNLYYTGGKADEVGFILGTDASLTNGEVVLAAESDSLNINTTMRPSGLFSLTIPSGTGYYCTYAKTGSDYLGDRIMYGDTLQYNSLAP